MASPEQPEDRKQQPSRTAGPHEPLRPSQLPAELAEFFADRDFACLTHPTDQGTVLLAKLPNREVESIVGTVPIEFRHELHEYPTAPVIRIVTTIYDQPDRPLSLETFINVGDPQQRADYEALASQEQLYLLFYDEGLAHRLTKAVLMLNGDRIADILARADALFHAIHEDRFSFEVAKAAVMRRTTL